MSEVMKNAFEQWAVKDGYTPDGVNPAKLHAEAGWQGATAHFLALLEAEWKESISVPADDGSYQAGINRGLAIAIAALKEEITK